MQIPKGQGQAQSQPVRAQSVPEAEPADEPSVVELYMSAPQQLKNKARDAVGARNDDDLLSMLADEEVAATVRSILSSSEEESLLTSSPTKTPPEDVLFPRRM